MRRPAALFALLFSLMMYLVISLTGYPESLNEELDGDHISVTGTVCAKERKAGDNEEETVLNCTLCGLSVSPRMEGLKESDRTVLEFRGNEEEIRKFEDILSLGRTVTAAGSLSIPSEATNPGEFDLREYYSVLHIRFRLEDARILRCGRNGSRLRENLYGVRREFAAVLDRYLDREDAGVMKAMLLGEKGFLDAELKEMYAENGISHVLSISGLHITLLGMGIYRLLSRMKCRRILKTAPAVIFMVCYGEMSGSGVSTVRAVIMFALKMTALQTGRTFDPLTAASLTAVSMIAGNPAYLRHSGFLFSFISVTGASLFGGREWSEAEKKAVIPVCTVPIYLFRDGYFPVSGILFNLAVIPLMGMLLPCGIAVAAGGTLAAGAGRCAAFPVHCILLAFRALCLLGERIPGVTAGSPQRWQVLLYYSVLLSLWAAEEFRPGMPPAIRKMIVLGALSLLVFRSREGLCLHFLDVGQGDGIVMETQSVSVLIDGGSSSKSEVGKYQILPFLRSRGIGKIDLAVVTHDDTDHVNGLIELLERGFPVKEVAVPAWADMEQGNFATIAELCSEADIPVVKIRRGMTFGASGLWMMVLHPGTDQYEDGNQGSVVLRINYGSFSAVLTGDLEKEGEREMVDYLSEKCAGNTGCVLLKAGHHGSANATGEDLLDVLHPSVAVISCGRNNIYGHPAEETLQRIRNAEAQIYDTRYCGEITFQTDGEKLRVIPFLQRISADEARSEAP